MVPAFAAPIAVRYLARTDCASGRAGDAAGFSALSAPAERKSGSHFACSTDGDFAGFGEPRWQVSHVTRLDWSAKFCALIACTIFIISRARAFSGFSSFANGLTWQ